jgi:diguanylate cyclase (GGDEF)-like protein/PAS domain S-box-containing protein
MSEVREGDRDLNDTRHLGSALDESMSAGVARSETNPTWPSHSQPGTSCDIGEASNPGASSRSGGGSKPGESSHPGISSHPGGARQTRDHAVGTTDALRPPRPRWKVEAPLVVPGLVALAILLWEAGRHGLAASEPLWLIAAVLAAAAIGGYAADLAGPGSPRALLHVRFALKAAVVTAVAFSTGWGPVLTAGLFYPVADATGALGSVAAAPALGWSLVMLALGEVALASGLAPSMLHQAPAHMLAGLTATGLVASSLVLASFARRREASESDARERYARFAALVEQAADMLLVVDPRQFSISYASPAARRVLGPVDPEGIFSQGGPLHPDDVGVMVGLVEEAVARPAGSSEADVYLRRADGQWRCLKARCTNLVGTPGLDGVVLQLRDVTEEQALQAELAIRAMRDPVTGLFNREAILAELEELLAERVVKEVGFNLVFADLDRFKEVNDHYGHHVGDELLVALSRRMVSCLRPTDVLGRLGGDEFVAILRGATEAPAVAKRLFGVCSTPFHVAGEEISVGISLGVAAVAPGELTMGAAALLREADQAMYRAKKAGRGRIVVIEIGPESATG